MPHEAPSTVLPLATTALIALALASIEALTPTIVQASTVFVASTMALGPTMPLAPTMAHTPTEVPALPPATPAVASSVSKTPQKSTSRRKSTRTSRKAPTPAPRSKTTPVSQPLPMLRQPGRSFLHSVVVPIRKQKNSTLAIASNTVLNKKVRKPRVPKIRPNYLAYLSPIVGRKIFHVLYKYQIPTKTPWLNPDDFNCKKFPCVHEDWCRVWIDHMSKGPKFLHPET